jgi:hypothetical protein
LRRGGGGASSIMSNVSRGAAVTNAGSLTARRVVVVVRRSPDAVVPAALTGPTAIGASRSAVRGGCESRGTWIAGDETNTGPGPGCHVC